jgi:hypothetical protein
MPELLKVASYWLGGWCFGLDLNHWLRCRLFEDNTQLMLDSSLV